MTRDDIMRWAAQARLPSNYATGEPMWPDRLERFAALVAAAERERLAQPEQEPRQWVGLTEDEVTQAMYRADAIVTGPMQFKFAKEIEAALKEKNGAN